MCIYIFMVFSLVCAKMHLKLVVYNKVYSYYLQKELLAQGTIKTHEIQYKLPL
jgi:hypothetical protein